MFGTEGLFVGAGEGGEELGLVFGVGHGASEHLQQQCSSKLCLNQPCAGNMQAHVCAHVLTAFH